jgi:hypothetical protein
LAVTWFGSSCGVCGGGGLMVGWLVVGGGGYCEMD